MQELLAIYGKTWQNYMAKLSNWYRMGVETSNHLQMRDRLYAETRFYHVTGWHSLAKGQQEAP